MEFVGMVCRRMFLGLMLMDFTLPEQRSLVLYLFAAWARVYCDIPCKATEEEDKTTCVGF